MNNPILAYFITFTTYGTWLHGDERGSIVRQDGTTLKLGKHTGMYKHEYQKLKNDPVTLNSAKRQIVLETIIKHCDIRQWHLYAVHVRSNHVHIVVKSNKSADLTASELKNWSARMLRKEGFDIPMVWTRGGSNKMIFMKPKLKEKIHYVVYEQGEMMEYYIDKAFAK
jgi:REP element-mobilizing transposase RayT